MTQLERDMKACEHILSVTIKCFRNCCYFEVKYVSGTTRTYIDTIPWTVYKYLDYNFKCKVGG